MKMCQKCKQVYPDLFFYRETKVFRNPRISKIYKLKKSICRGCRIAERTEKKIENRSRQKAYRTLIRHADNYIQKYEHLEFDVTVKTREEFANEYGWDLDQMVKDIEHTRKGKCPYCHRRFPEMKNGYADITLDIYNPQLAPHYHNTRWACSTCNQAKRRMTPVQWQKFMDCMKVWEAWDEKSKDDPYAGLPLLEGL